ncbi:tetraacyldisaccharide 4'-kinase [Rodentibacter trehalosifermentans]|uniref:Tetraacyldisaccharide 4'-kinase n=1 Tax=Rodentibacter trehalosifermentans TaxID=1908263 RepID=A0A1V3IZ45_9PAST|nr:tetraacyldisaccharide 4'-kinase [Rodentibacter trehalosifermentans]OOF47308.1 tetraacyldisaccharide 4'-kinase [Rodentibacter trehalosifermentans]OOF49025.1 tetraacyldisaccharide 4'-kinase [Rodentibacter trehalosifermentans]OOF53363.1 tetraacyldisaccharide 4'-kinase [Rodentibacter trehalosifermentans]
MPFWYSNSKLAWLLLPFSLVFWFISQIRRALFSLGIKTSYRAPKPVVVVGNLSVGGNGKTPVVVWLSEEIKKRGWRVGVISRGYGSKAKTYPLLVSAETDPIEGGDEPVLIAKRTGVPVVISANRRQAIELLLKHCDCDIIISDDGLQHYSLQRDIEIVVMDAKRALGNGFVLPAGPLRELPSRLKTVDFVITNGGKNRYSDALMRLVPHYAIHLKTNEKRPLSEFQSGSAIAGIGHPPRFFSMLEKLGIALIQTQGFQDHQHFDAAQLAAFPSDQPLFMTEKDAVKCQAFAQDNWWYIPVEAEIVEAEKQGEKLPHFWKKIEALVERDKNA